MNDSTSSKEQRPAHPADALEGKRARFERQDSPGKKRLLIGGAVIALAALAVALLVALRAGGPPRAAQVAAAVPTGATSAPATLDITAADLADGRARHYAYRAPSSREIRFFLVRSSDGVIRAAFDACDVCFPARKGYRQQGDAMICNNCGQSFATARINEERGGCNPSPLERRLEGGTVRIAVADLLAGARYF